MAEVEAGQRKWYETVIWHISSRRSRTAIAAVVACVILNHPKLRAWFGVDEKTAATFANQLILLAGVLIAALTGEKFIPNGNGNEPAVTPSVEGAVVDAIEVKIKDKLDKKFDELMDKLKVKVNSIT